MMTNKTCIDQQDQTQPTLIADLREVPLDQLPGDYDCDDLVGRILGRQRYSWRVDVAAFGNFI